MKHFIRKNTFLPSISHGFGNGYVLIPEDHPYHGISYENIRVDVHGGLTFSEIVDEEFIKDWKDSLSEEDLGSWCVGFDTYHFGDNLLKWSEENVEKETIRLKEQLIDLTALTAADFWDGDESDKSLQ